MGYDTENMGKNIKASADAQTQIINERNAAAAAAAAKAKADADAAQKAAALKAVSNNNAANTDDNTTTNTGTGDAADYAKSALSDSEYSCLSNIITHESGWNVHATNASSGAYGLGQALPGSKMASFGDDWKDNGVTQIKWVISYLNGRYGSPCGGWSFWQSNNWY
jgi:membrane protein involved in colicin uptake